MKTFFPSHIKTATDKARYLSFRSFLLAIWQHLLLPQPTEIQNDIAAYLQSGPRRRIIQAFRGAGKSWITAAYVLWLLYRDPQHKVLVVSASKERADAFSVFVRRLISEVSFLRTLEPRDDQRTSNIAFDVGPALADQSPSVKSVGVTGQLTGSRADTIVADDIEVPKNSFTEMQRDKLGELVKEFDSILKPNGQVIYLGTPQVAESLYSFDNLQARGYACRVWTARYTAGMGDSGGDIYFGNLAPLLTNKLTEDPSLLGQPTEPSRFNESDLQEREKSYGRSGFALQFMLDTSLNDATRYPLKLSDLLIFDVNQEVAPVRLTWNSAEHYRLDDLSNVGLNGDYYVRPNYVSDEVAEYDGSVMFIDPSGRGRDETSYCVTKMLRGMVYVRQWAGLTGGYDEKTLTKLATIAKLEGVNKVLIESNFGDGMYLALSKPVFASIYPCGVDEYKVTGQKELRIIDKLEPVLNSHRLVLDKAAVKKDIKQSSIYSGLYQLTHITKDRGSLTHDDRIDVLAEAVHYWLRHLQLDVGSVETKHAQKLKDIELERFMDNIKGRNGAKKRSTIYRSDGTSVLGRRY